jgi:glycosyltransferase involved in cell wall biosynthesis
MRITLVNQAFHPDVVSTSQYLTELALELTVQGHEVTVIASRRAYDAPKTTFPPSETWRGIRIHRLFATGFGKGSKWRRALDFGSFMISAIVKLFLLPRQDVLVAMTSPPLIAFIAACASVVRGWRFCYWIMDLNPDEALAAGWLRPGSSAAIWLDRFSRFSLRRANTVIVLDRFMRERILAKGIESAKIAVIPPWSHDHEVHFDEEGRNRFRKKHNLENRFVVMYSGNHSPCHPLDTILAATVELAGESDVAFCFVGGGSQFARVQAFAREHPSSKILCLPYQPLSDLAASLSAADLHLIVMGNPFVGLVHPSKIYNAMRVGSALFYIGPQPSHVSDIFAEIKGHPPFGSANHGEVRVVVDSIIRFKNIKRDRSAADCSPVTRRFAKQELLPKLVHLLDSPRHIPLARRSSMIERENQQCSEPSTHI